MCNKHFKMKSSWSNTENLNRIFLNGGVVSPGKLKEIVTALELCGLNFVNLGSRQDLLFPKAAFNKKQSEKMEGLLNEFSACRTYQNIVSSYVSSDIFDNTSWLTGSAYLYILENFDFQPKLKVNIVDPKQTLVPVFSGHLNFIASEKEDYWYLYMDLPDSEKGKYSPMWIYSWDIPMIVKTIEQKHASYSRVDQLLEALNQSTISENKIVDKPLKIQYCTFPYYEGVNKMGINKYWLGLYWRDNQYNLGFLKELCSFCLNNCIGKICITPWKSLIIKGIPQSAKLNLECLLGKWGINVRHSQLEMNWHLPVNDYNALELKRFLVNKFDNEDISTYGLTFGISTRPNRKNRFSAVLIEKNKPDLWAHRINIRPTYNVLHFKNFDPNTLQIIPYAQDVDKVELPALLIELSKKYFTQLDDNKPEINTVEEAETPAPKEVYQCEECMSVYDPEYGDQKANALHGTPFEDLPSQYVCSTCGAQKSSFIKTYLTQIK